MIRALLTAALLSLAPAAPAGPERDNPALLGIVAVRAEEGVRVAAVVPESPAAAVGIRAGDVLLELAGTELGRPQDVDSALKDAAPGDEVAVSVVRDGEELALGAATLIARHTFDSPWVRPRRTGELDFEAAEWFAFDWDGLAEGESPPTLAAATGKVVVIHSFQAWWPGCRERGFPTHRKVEAAYAELDDVVAFHLHTVFEGFDRNTPWRGVKEARRHGIEVPVAFDARVDGSRLSLFMTRYGTGGTPWTTIIDRRGRVRFSKFSPGNAGVVKRVVKDLLREEPPPSPADGGDGEPADDPGRR